jgi:hypothetical protein
MAKTSIVLSCKKAVLLLFVLSVVCPAAEASSPGLLSARQEVLPHEVGAGHVSFSLPSEVMSVSLQGFSEKQKFWRTLATAQRPKLDLTRLRIPRNWAGAKLRVVANYPPDSSARRQVKSKTDWDRREVTFTSTARAKLFSIEARQKSSAGWSRVSTVAAAPKPQQIRVPLPKTLPQNSEIRVVAVSNARKTSPNLATPLSAKMRSGPSFFAVGAQSVSTGAMSSFDVAVSSSPSLAGDARSASSAAAVPEESDIWKIRGSNIYFFNRLRGLQVIDVSDPSAPQTPRPLPLAAAGEEMYLLGSDPAKADSALLITGRPWSPTDAYVTRLSSIDLLGSELDEVFSIDLPGYYVESRLVGGLLHVVTTSWSDASGVWSPKTYVTTVDVSQHGVLNAAPSRVFDGSAAQAGSTGKYLWVATHANGRWWQNHTLLAFPMKVDGSLEEPVSADLGGVLQDKFKVGDTSDGLAVVVQSWDGSFQRQSTSVETYREDQDALSRITSLELVSGESLFASRFQGDRLYVVTFRQIDPLLIVDLSDSSNPVVKGHLEVPGYSTYIQPVGDKLIAIGRDGGNIQVSMFDVSDETAPLLADRVDVAAGWSWSEAEWNEKAVKILPEAGVILLPVVEWDQGAAKNGVKLVDFDTSLGELTLRGTIEHAFSPRRAALLNDSLIASVSNRELLLVDASDRDQPSVASRVMLAFGVDLLCVDQGTAFMIENGGSPWGGASRSAILRIAPVDDPDAVFNEIELPCQSVVAAEIVGNRLVMAETQGNEPDVWLLAAKDAALPTSSPSSGNTISAWSLEALKVPGADGDSARLGSAELPFQPATDTEIVSVGGGRVAVVSRQRGWNYWFRPLPIVVDSAVRMDDMARPACFPWIGWGNESLDIAIAEVAGDAPSVVGTWRLPEGEEYSNFSQVYPAGDLLVFSYDITSRVAPVKASDPQPWGWETWQTRCMLQILDLADPSLPMPWAPVQLPGQLLGVSWLQRAGGVVFARSGANVAALGFDGENASLAAEVAAGDCLAMQGSELYTAAEGGVAAWSFSEDSGQWIAGSGWKFDPGYGLSSLSVRADGTLLAGNYSGAWVLRGDGSISGSVLPAGSRLDRAAQITGGFLVPAGQFGVVPVR